MIDKSVLLNLSADRPIRSLKEDSLGRGTFAISMASAIRHWNSADSLVMAVYGPWGHGKTSVKNLTLSLLQSTDDAPAIVEFNPWNWTGEDRIHAAFFEEVGVAIGEKASGPDSKELALKWKKYATRMTLGGTALEHLRTASEVAGIPWAPLIFGSLAKAAKSTATVSEQASDSHAAELDQTVEELKDSVRDALAKLDRPVLVVMDDIDRLTTEEIRLLFRVIKANADFPNMIYLLLFEREVVENALTGVTGSAGRSYMEKIVQAGFDLPRVQQADIDHALSTGLDALLSYEGVEKSFDSDRWQNLYRDSLRPFFQSLRDVRRFLSTFSFELGLFYRDNTLDINFIDLVGLEVLRVFEPDLHMELVSAKEVLIKTPYSDLLGRETKDDLLKDFASVMEKATDDRRDVATTLIAELFPKIGWALKGHGYGMGFEEGWERTLRACHYRMFDRYFIMSLPKGEVPMSILTKIIGTTEREQLVEVFCELNENEQLSAALERLEAYKTTLDLKHAKPFVTALLDIDTLIPFDPSGSFGMSTDMSVVRIIHHYMMQQKDRVKRSKSMVKCLKNCTGVWMPVRFVSIEEPDDDERDLDKNVFDADGLIKAKEICVSKMKESKLEGIDGQKLISCLFRWKDWAGAAEPQAWCKEQISSISGALRIVRACVSTSHISGGYGTTVKRIVNMEYLDEFTDIDQVAKTLEPILNEKTEGHEAIRTNFELEIDAFKKGLKRRAEGKSDDWRHDEDGET